MPNWPPKMQNIEVFVVLAFFLCRSKAHCDGSPILNSVSVPEHFQSRADRNTCKAVSLTVMVVALRAAREAAKTHLPRSGQKEIDETCGLCTVVLQPSTT